MKVNYDEFISRAVKNDELEELLCGKEPYKVILSEFEADIFPTNINSVLMNCIYRKINVISNIDKMFEECLLNMLEKDAGKAYIAILYFDACIFQEEHGKATFTIAKEVLINKIKDTINKNRTDFENTIYFENGMKKSLAINNICNFNKYYEKRYGFSIM